MASSCEISEVTTNDSKIYRTSVSQDATSQETLRERYEEQQRRLACPSCGEESFLD
jgi:hypothetical protein